MGKTQKGHFHAGRSTLHGKENVDKKEQPASKRPHRSPLVAIPFAPALTVGDQL
jgi:hypothetical protein